MKDILNFLIRQNPYQKNILEVIDKISEKFENLPCFTDGLVYDNHRF